MFDVYSLKSNSLKSSAMGRKNTEVMRRYGRRQSICVGSWYGGYLMTAMLLKECVIEERLICDEYWVVFTISPRIDGGGVNRCCLTLNHVFTILSPANDRVKILHE